MANNKPQDPDRNAEQWLDDALSARMGATAEPRPGIEERVLARLAKEPERKATYWWALAFIGVAAVILIAAAVLIVRPRAPESPSVARAGRPVVSNPAPVVTRKAAVAFPKPEQKNRRRTLQAVNRSPFVRQKAITPKLATFPAPSPETDQERMLARLAARHGAFDIAEQTPDLGIQDLQVKELAVEPMEGTPPDIPQ